MHATTEDGQGVWTRTDHGRRPEVVDGCALGDGGTVDVDDPEQRRQVRLSSDLASQTNTSLTGTRTGRRARDHRCVYSDRTTISH